MGLLQQERRRARGLCVRSRCKNKPTINKRTGYPFRMCRDCRLVNSKQYTARYHKRKNAKRCVRCKGEHDTKFALCQSCREMRRISGTGRTDHLQSAIRGLSEVGHVASAMAL